MAVENLGKCIGRIILAFSPLLPWVIVIRNRRGGGCFGRGQDFLSPMYIWAAELHFIVNTS